MRAAVTELVERCAADERVELAGLWTHFATADEDDDAFLREQLDALPRRSRRRCGRAIRA